MHLPSKIYFTRSQLKSYIDQHNKIANPVIRSQEKQIQLNGSVQSKMASNQKKGNLQKRNSIFPLQNFAGMKKDTQSQNLDRLKCCSHSPGSLPKLTNSNSFSKIKQRPNKKQLSKQPKIVKVSQNMYQYQKFNTEITQKSSKRQEINKYLFGKYQKWMKLMSQRDIFLLYESISQQRKFHEKNETKYKLLELQRNVELIQSRNLSLGKSSLFKNRLQGIQGSRKQNRVHKNGLSLENSVDESDCFVINVENYESCLRPEIVSEGKNDKISFEPKQKFPLLQKHVIIHHSEYSDYSYSNSINQEGEVGKQLGKEKEEQKQEKQKNKSEVHQGGEINYEKLYRDSAWLAKWIQQKQRFQIFVELSNIPSKSKQKKDNRAPQAAGNKFCRKVTQDLGRQEKKTTSFESKKKSFKQQQIRQRKTQIQISKPKEYSQGQEKTGSLKLAGRAWDPVKKELGRDKRVQEFTRQNKLGEPLKKVHLSFSNAISQKEGRTQGTKIS